MDPLATRPDDENSRLLHRLRTRRRVPDPQTVAFLEQAQESAGGRRTTREMPDAGTVRAMYPNRTEAEIAEMSRYFAELDSAIRPPTRYEGRHHRQVQVYAAQLDEAVARHGRWPAADNPPLFATTESGHGTAAAIRVPHTGDHLVLVDSELLQFLFLFSKAVALAVPAGTPTPDGILRFATEPEEIRANLRRDPQILFRFHDVVLSYAMTGSASRAEAYRVPPATERLYGIVMQSAQTFVLAHEYAHVLEGHLDDGDPGGEHLAPPQWPLPLEGVADRFGFELTLEVMKKAGYDLYFTYWGIELFLSANEILLKAISLLRTGDEHGLRHDERHRQAGFDARRRSLETMLRTDLERASGKATVEAEWDRIGSGLHVVRDIVHILWGETEPLLRKAHADGSRPAVWWDSGG
ncbi:hypothetical protein GCM10022222_34400 [Amycolatopsis ultiminotia]|uniref:Uncharacterized protein n=1 Tax=Amycolatopsis ultiminotia TaxID=543629 RepID=A0ABP6WD39_9PSEU